MRGDSSGEFRDSATGRSTAPVSEMFKAIQQTLRQTCLQLGRLKAPYAFDMYRFLEPCNSPYFTQFAAFFIDLRTE